MIHRRHHHHHLFLFYDLLPQYSSSIVIVIHSAIYILCNMPHWFSYDPDTSKSSKKNNVSPHHPGSPLKMGGKCTL